MGAPNIYGRFLPGSTQGSAPAAPFLGAWLWPNPAPALWLLPADPSLGPDLETLSPAGGPPTSPVSDCRTLHPTLLSAQPLASPKGGRGGAWGVGRCVTQGFGDPEGGVGTAAVSPSGTMPLQLIAAWGEEVCPGADRRETEDQAGQLPGR